MALAREAEPPVERKSETGSPGLRNQGVTAEDLNAVDERKLVRKLDLYLIPLVMGLYLFSFLDRYEI